MSNVRMDILPTDFNNTAHSHLLTRLHHARKEPHITTMKEAPTDNPTIPEGPKAKSSLGVFLPDIALVGVAAIWGVNIPIMKSGLDQLDNVLLFNAVRLPISALVLSFFALRERRQGILPRDVTWIQLGIYAMMISVTYQLCFLIGMSLTTPGNTALIISTVPIWTALLARAFLGDKLRRLAWCGLMIAVVGTVVVAVQKGVSVDAKHLWGNLIVLASALLWAAGTVYSRPMLNRISAMQLAATASCIGLPFHFLAAATQVDRSQDILATFAPLGSPILLLVILYSGTLSSGLSQPMWHFGVKRAGASHAAIVQNLVPVFALLAAWMISREIPTTAQAIGGSLILVGLVTMRLSRRNT